MEMLRRSSVFAAEVFDRSPTDKELVSQAKALCREYIHSRLNRAGIGWSKPEHAQAGAGGALGEVSSVLLWLGEELEYLRPNVYRNVARQLNITVASESIVSDAFLAVAADIFSTGGHDQMCGEHGPQLPLPLAAGCRLRVRTLPEGCCAAPPQREMRLTPKRDSLPSSTASTWIMFTLTCTEPLTPPPPHTHTNTLTPLFIVPVVSELNPC
uniref:BCL2 family apoptosis regulator BOK a n=1 Tax=Oryzias sinensis TaxID=183150 RepID=A0A8C7ZEK3_9TELE